MNMPARPVVTTAGRLLFEKGFTRVRVADEMQAEIEVLDGPASACPPATRSAT